MSSEVIGCKSIYLSHKILYLCRVSANVLHALQQLFNAITVGCRATADGEGPLLSYL